MAYDIKLMSLLITANVTESFEFSCIQVLWIAGMHRVLTVLKQYVSSFL